MNHEFEATPRGSHLGFYSRGYSWKSYSGKRLAGLVTSGGGIWFREYWDRFIRDQAHFDATVHYIENNPVAARLVQRPEDWPWSSASSKR